MIYSGLYTKLKTLPQSALEEVASYVDYVFYKFTTSEKQNNKKTKKKGFGCLKNIPCKMSPDFDKPIEDFAEYM
ncbi:MAG: DUF2281 domain-containing protein [Treponema sp.]|jgi:hypothetical protein|nr:DUF2281 domain-containing protein [Treponema sp.]